MTSSSDISTFDSEPSVREDAIHRIPKGQVAALSPQPVGWNDLIARSVPLPIATFVSESEQTVQTRMEDKSRAETACEMTETEGSATRCVREPNPPSPAIPESVVTALAEAASALRNVRSEVRNDWEQQLFVVAVAMARKILQRELTRTTPIALEKIESILDFVVTCPEIRLSLHPDDFAAIAPFQEQIRQSSGLEQIFWEADETIARGGCRLRWAYGSLEAGPEQELQRILEEWMPEES